MTIASEISRLQSAKSCMKAAIEDKGVSVGSDVKLDDYAACIGEIQQGATEGILPITAPTLTGVAGISVSCLKRNDPDDDSCRGTQLTCWTGTSLVRKLGGDPQSIDDGTLVINSKNKNAYCSTYYQDNSVTANCEYHYRVFANTSIGLGNCSNVVCLRPSAIYNIDFLIVGGGGGGGSPLNYQRSGGGGGAGGAYLKCGCSLLGGIYPIVIGAGGTAGNNGGDSCGLGFVMCGGGTGGNGSCMNGCPGGSGGGATASYSGGVQYASGGNPVNSAYGKAGGGACGSQYSSCQDAGGGGGGAGGAGCYGIGRQSSSQYRAGGNGGIGISTDIDGTTKYYAGGGAGLSRESGYGTDGCGAENCGGGGKAACAGKNGVFILRYKTSCGYNITGGCKYTCGDYTIHCFTSSGTLTFN